MQCNKKQLKIYNSVIIILSLMLCSSLHSETKSPINISTIHLMANGNCLPISVESISLINVIQVSETRITSVAFINSSDIIAVSLSGCVYLCDIVSNTFTNILNLEPDYWYIVAVKPGQMLFINKGEVNNEQIRVNDIYCINSNGTELWRYDNYIGSYPILYNNDYYFINNNSTANRQLSMFTDSGNILQMFQFHHGYGVIPFVLPSELGLITISISEGPYLIENENGTYSIDLFHDGWNSGIFRGIITSEGVILELHNRGRDLLILDPKQQDSLLIDYANQLEIQQPEQGNPLITSRWLASTGSEIYILYSSNLVSYNGNIFKILYDDIDKISSDGYLGPFYTDNNGNFIIALTNGLCLLKSEPSIISFEGNMSTDIVFNSNYELASCGTEEGKLIVYRIEQNNQ